MQGEVFLDLCDCALSVCGCGHRVEGDWRLSNLIRGQEDLIKQVRNCCSC